MDSFYLHRTLKLTNFIKSSEVINMRLKEIEKIEPIEVQRKPLKNQENKKKMKFLKKELKRNPDNAPYQGKKIKFDRQGKIMEVISVTPTLNILSPAEEFQKKKSE